MFCIVAYHVKLIKAVYRKRRNGESETEEKKRAITHVSKTPEAIRQFIS
jgi:hypothetical protein